MRRFQLGKNTQFSRKKKAAPEGAAFLELSAGFVAD